ncbi:MAG TPA: family 20 glycosylhydrolase [Terriglobia bacterium]|nr:family 20 glycosylhydrolase [Terriglobia bacterium]
MKSKRLMITLIVALAWCCASVQAQTLNLMPQPVKAEIGSGRLVIDGSFRVALDGYMEPRLEAVAARLTRRLSLQTGIPMPAGLEANPGKAALVLHCDHAGEAVQSVREDESYQLDVTAQQARLTAPTPVGVLRGAETFLQLVALDAQGFGAPAIHIVDRPRFPWRGLTIDVSRHWMPAEVLKRNMDAMATVKLNVLHLHLTDDQGFRIESKKYPKLQELGSDGHFYSQAEIAELLAYARDRGIRIVPEIEMPGHSTSWYVGYPGLASGPGPFQIERKWGIFDPTLDPTREETYEFLDGLIGEVAAVFPDEYLHVGGDEVNGKEWDTNPRILEFKKSHGMKDNADLQLYFNGRLLPIVQKHGKKMVGWDEIFHPGLPKDIVVHSWRGPESLAQTARLGYMSILSNGYYLDFALAPADYYRVDPLGGAAASLAPDQASRILGGEACMWSELVTPENVDSRIWPSTAAIAERFWSPREVTDVDSMYRRLAIVSRELNWVGLTHHSSLPLMLERLAGMQAPDALRTLADVLEPIKEYKRENSREYTSLSAYNRLVDAARPASEKARVFSGMVDQWRENEATIRRQLVVWRDCQESLAPLLKSSALLQENAPSAEDLTKVANAGLEALDHLDSGRPAPQAWVQQQSALLDSAAKPHAELMLMIVPPVRKLVEEAGKGSR